MSDLSQSLSVAHLSWATWAIHSWSLISSEQPQRFAHNRSFVLSDLSESLTVAHLIWAKWANEQIPSPAPYPPQKIKTKNKPTPLLLVTRFSAAKKIRNLALQFLKIFSVFAVFELSLSFNCIHKCTYHILYALQNSITSYSTVVLWYTVCMSISILLNTV